MKSLQRLLFTAAMLLAPLAIAHATDLVIVESTASDLPAGQVVKAGVPITIPAGTQISVVGEDGKVIRLSGPFSGLAAPASAAAGDKGTVQALSRLFADKGPAATSWGTFRGEGVGEEAGNPPDVWSVNLLRSETVCVPTGTRPLLWRADASQPMSAILLEMRTGREGTIVLDAGQQTLPWPQTPAIVDAGEYALREPDGSGERRLVVRVIPANTATGVSEVAWMSDAGCLRQAKQLLARVAGG